MATDNILRSYGDTTRVEDVLGLVEILTAHEDWFLTNLGKTTCRDTVHQTLVDTTRGGSSAAVSEAGDYTYLARTTPTRLTNLVQNIAIPFKVSKTQQLIDHYHGQDEKSRQLTKALIDWGDAAEFDILRSTLTSGVSGTTPKMSGLIEATSKSTTHTTQTSGTVWSSSILKGLLKNNWTNSQGEPVQDIFMGAELKEDTDTFTAGSTKFMPQGAEVLNFVDVYDGGGFGRVAIHLHRFVQQSGDSTGRVFAIRKDKLALAYLEMPRIDEGLQRDGDYDALAVVGKLTVEVRNQDTNFFAEGYLI